MNFCSERGIPHSQFLDWDPSDRSKQIAFLLEESEKCQLCGTASWEWDEDRFAYAPVEKFCQGCYLKQVSSEGANASPGTTIEMVPVTPMFQAQQKMEFTRRRKMMTEE